MRPARFCLVAVLAAAPVLVSGCNKQHPYRSDEPASQRTAGGTPADRTGGARDVPVWKEGIPNTKPEEVSGKQQKREKPAQPSAHSGEASRNSTPAQPK